MDGRFLERLAARDDVPDVLVSIGPLDTGRALWLVQDAVDANVVPNSVSFGLSADPDDVIPKAVGFFSRFPAMFIAYPIQEAAVAMARAIQDYAPDLTVLTPKPDAFGRFHSVAEMSEEAGVRAVSHLLMDAVEHSPLGLLDLADVQFEQIPHISSGFPELDKTIGGMRLGELSVWTGKRGGGKSTILGQVLLGAVEQGAPVCAYSGELAAGQFKSWMMQQAAGPQFVSPRQDEFGRTHYTIPTDVMRKIDQWWREMFFLYDNRMAGASDEDSIVKVFEYADRKYGCTVYLVDNLMATRFRGNDRDFYRAQSSFTGRLVEFAKKRGVHVHLVAHPRKTGRIQDADEVSGTGDITNRADNVFAMERLYDAAREDCQTVLSILKNRDFGESGHIKLDYDARSRRFYKHGSMLGPNYQYGWNRQEALWQSKNATKQSGRPTSA